MIPGRVRVMEPIKAATVPSGPDLTFQVKWDGIRALAFCRDGGVTLQNKGRRIITASFPEFNCLGNIRDQPLVLDGEMVVVRAGKPSFPLIVSRNFQRQPAPGAPPASYIIFDILSWGGEDLRGRPLARRQEILNSLTLPPGPVLVIDNFQDGQKLFAAVGDKGWEGIVAKDLNGLYCGGKSPAWKKIKHSQEDTFFIVGYMEKNGELSSLLLGYDWGEGLMPAGKVGSGMTENGRRLLKEVLPALAAGEAPIKTANKAAKWLKPLLAAKVEFMEWTEGRTLRAPVIKKLLWEGREYAIS